MTPEQIVRLAKLQEELEWRRCAVDPDYFFKTYVKTVDKTSATGYSTFEMTPYQKEDLAAFEEHAEIIILKARQLGISTLLAAYVLHKILFKPGFNVITTSKSDTAAQSNNAKLNFAYHSLPGWMKAKFKVESETTSVFRIRHLATGMVSQMRSVAATETVGASDTYDLAVLDEFALSKYQDKTYSTIKPATQIAATMKKSASMIILSTARGSHDMFCRMYRAAERGENSFHPIFHPWHASPWMTQAKYEAEAAAAAAKGQPWEIYSEYPSTSEEAFRESGQPLFRDLPPIEVLEDFDFRGNVIETLDGDLAFQPDDFGPLRIKDLGFAEDGYYVLSADSSSGEQGDYQAALLMTMDDANPDEDPKIMAYYHTNDRPPEEFAEDLDRIGRFFAGRQHAALLSVENQGGYGTTVINHLTTRLQYPNPYVFKAVGKRSKSRIAGTAHSFPMSRNIREAILDRLREYLAPVNAGSGNVSEPRIKNLFPLLRWELGAFVRQVLNTGNVKYAADTGCNDDLVMALAMGNWVLLETYHAPDAQERTVDEKTQWESFLMQRQRIMERTAEADSSNTLIYL